MKYEFFTTEDYTEFKTSRERLDAMKRALNEFSKDHKIKYMQYGNTSGENAIYSVFVSYEEKENEIQSEEKTPFGDNEPMIII